MRHWLLKHLFSRPWKWTVIGRSHDRANIEQLARRSMVISMLIRKAGGL